MGLLVKLAAATSIVAPVGSGIALAQTSQGVQVPAHERIVLDNGITLIVMPRREVPLIAFSAILRGGTLADPPDKPGVASLVAGLLEKGADERDAYAFADAVEGVGGSFAVGASSESISVGGQFLARDRDLMLELLADALQRPRFERGEFEKLRTRQIELIKAAKDSDPSELIGVYGRAWLFGAHPYGRPVVGSESSLAAIGHEDVVEYARAHFGADRLAIVLTGEVESGWAKRAVARAFGAWHKARTPLPPLPEPARLAERRVLLVDSPGSVQSYFWLGNVGVEKRFPQRAALDLVNTLYGGRFTSILNTELRIRSGLSYGARSGFSRGTVPGEFAIRSFTQTENTAKALDLTLQTLERLQKEGIGQEMLDSSRAYVLGQYPLSLETAAHWAAAMSELELYGLGPDYIEGYGPALRAVALRDTRAVIDRAFPGAGQLAMVLIGDASKIRSVAERYGAVAEIPITLPAFSP
ncbi:MAG: M16 family metallopeptidase [Gammaproteobacteria bacterium]